MISFSKLSRSDMSNSWEENDMHINYSQAVLDDFRENVGRFPAETGGLLGSSESESMVDLCHFDTKSQNTAGTFYYDIESMSAVFREWKSKGYVTNGIYHSHPAGIIRPSYHDISSALLHIEFLQLNYFYLPILQANRNGLYTMYSYVVRKKEDVLEVTLEFVLEAREHGYSTIPFSHWSKEYSIRQLRSYRDSIENVKKKGVSHSFDTKAETRKGMHLRIQKSFRNKESSKARNMDGHNKKKRFFIKKTMPHIKPDMYFSKVASLYPKHVLEKVIVCVGTGGARSFLENMARGGFKYFILMDADIVSPTNIATQGVFISEMGRKKTEVIRERIMDINPEAEVLCVDKFLDNNMSDEEFKRYLDKYSNRKSTDYLILGCTDSFEAQKRSSMIALKYGIPYLAAMMYAEGAAAEVIFTYPGVTASCPRCMLRDRFEKYEHGFVNDVDSSACPIFATERMNSLKGYIALMLLMYGEDAANPLSRMLEDVKDRNFVEIRLTPYLRETKLGIGLFDRIFSSASKYVFFDETIWVPQHPDSPEYGMEPCKMCGGKGNLKLLSRKWKNVDTRRIRMDDSAEMDILA